ncbi:unnamed protein product [Rangifer tarandus platyrhynchus]|uniref:Uncharacterized protein n=2 Tax=Rangifer tarandus platyrhynchus TaxID=3082113 RepID=A0ABN8ZXC5_RANTA|nr:unnamed protein product [Rangifer tarandus platyrhynchus]
MDLTPLLSRSVASAVDSELLLHLPLEPSLPADPAAHSTAQAGLQPPCPGPQTLLATAPLPNPILSAVSRESRGESRLIHSMRNNGECRYLPFDGDHQQIPIKDACSLEEKL